MNQAITKMAPIQRKREEGEKKGGRGSLHALCWFYGSREGWQMGLGRSSLEDEVRYVCFLHLQHARNVIVI